MPEPKEVKEVMPTPVVKPPDVLKSKQECLNKIQDILKEYGGIESNISPNHEYWKLVNQYRGM